MLKKQYDFTPQQIRELVGAEEGDRVYCWVRPFSDDDYLNNPIDDNMCLRVMVVSKEEPR